jgi:hypothetical protein
VVQRDGRLPQTFHWHRKGVVAFVFFVVEVDLVPGPTTTDAKDVK